MAAAAASAAVTVAAKQSTCSHSLKKKCSFPPLIDIAVNLTDCVFVGVDWKGKQVHPSDFTNMMDRCEYHGVEKCLISGTSLVQCARAIRLCREDLESRRKRSREHKKENTCERCSGVGGVQEPSSCKVRNGGMQRRLFCTIGVHPANSSEFLVPLSDEERRYVMVHGGLLTDMGGDIRASEETTESTVADRTTSTTPTVSLTTNATENKAALPQSKSSSPSPLSSSFCGSNVKHYTTGSPLVFDTIGDEHKAYWREHQSSPYETERFALLEQLIEANRDIVAAVGECGLDGAELAYCPYDVQARYYKMQLALAAKLKLPLFLHSRDCGMRFVDATRDFLAEPHRYQIHREKQPVSPFSSSSSSSSPTVTGDTSCVTPSLVDVSAPYTFSSEFPLTGVVHSFTGDDEELGALLKMNTMSHHSNDNNKSDNTITAHAHGGGGTCGEEDLICKEDSRTESQAEVSELPAKVTATPQYTNFYFGLNGSAFRSEESARRSVTVIPLEKLLLETDAPWCDIRKDNFGYQFIRTAFKTIKKEKMKQSIIDERDPLVLVERRNEPCTMRNVLECYVGCRALFVDAAVDGVDDHDKKKLFENIANRVYQNTIELFPLLESADSPSSCTTADTVGKDSGRE